MRGPDVLGSDRERGGQQSRHEREHALQRFACVRRPGTQVSGANTNARKGERGVGIKTRSEGGLQGASNEELAIPALRGHLLRILLRVVEESHPHLFLYVVCQ